ncbi:MAG: hypothetical protein IT462_00405 [Planctomycetes bacterium]|nr:hypothetical protein [Planctomycetota bacterium]
MAEDDDLVARNILALSSPMAIEREEASRVLVDYDGNIGTQLRLAFDEAAEAEQLEMFEISRRRKDDALMLQAARALTKSDGQFREAAREYLYTLGPAEIAADKLESNELSAWRKFGEYARRRHVSTELIESVLKPGRSIAQFERLRDAEPSYFDEDLLGVLNLREEVAEALSDAAAESVSRTASSEMRRNLNWRRLGACQAFVPAMEWVREGKAGVVLRQKLRDFTEGTLVSAISVLQDLRAAAARALALSDSVLVLPGQLQAVYAGLAIEPEDPYLKRIVESSRIEVEIEIALSRFGQPEMLEERIAAMRRQVTRTQAPEAAVAARSVTDTELRLRNDIAYLLLRNASFAEAESEWKQMIADLKVTQPAANARQRGTLSAMLGGFYYNLACAQGLQLKAESGLESLRRSVEAGYGDYEWMLEDSDLDHVRAVPAFKDWFEGNAPPSIVDRFNSR